MSIRKADRALGTTLQKTETVQKTDILGKFPFFVEGIVVTPEETAQHCLCGGKINQIMLLFQTLLTRLTV